jgi:hypothetical protein
MISFLKAKTNMLESLVHASLAQAQTHITEATQEHAFLSALKVWMVSGECKKSGLESAHTLPKHATNGNNGRIHQLA